MTRHSVAASPLVQLVRVASLILCVLFALSSPSHAQSKEGIDYIIEQPPVFNTPTLKGYDALGLATGCGPCGCDEVSPSVNLGSEAILLHSGQEVCTATDFFIQGRDRGVDFRIIRRHTTRKESQNSPFGLAWSFNYRHTFVLDTTASPDTLDFTGFGRNDSFSQIGSTNKWVGTEGRLDLAIWDSTSSEMRVRRANGTMLVFHAEETSTSSGVFHGHLTEIRSPNSNTITIQYQTAAQEAVLLDRSILQVDDSFGRAITFAYNHSTNSKLVTSITDVASSRTYTYAYDSNENLQSFTTPADNNSVDPFSSGKTTSYTYRGTSGPAILERALTSVTYPNETASSGPARLAWTYYETSSLDEFGFVHTHTIGSGSVGGTFSYKYASQYDPNGNFDEDTPAVEVEVTDRRGTKIIATMNYLGQMLCESISNQSPSLRKVGAPSGPFERTFDYNADGLLVEETKPLGNSIRYEYPNPSAGWPRLSLGNQIKKTLIPDGRTSDQNQIVYRYDYEPVFNRKFRVTDPRGNATTYLYDYMENLPASTAALDDDMGMTFSELSTVLGPTVADIPNLNGDENGDTVTNQYCGNVIKVEYPTTTRPSMATDAPFGLPSTTENATELFWWNGYGQKVRHIDAEENIDEWAYYGASTPTSGTASAALTSGGGYLAEFREDITPSGSPSSTRNSGSSASPVDRVTKYEYGALAGGSYPANTRGVPTKITNPRGIETHRLVNVLDQVVQEVRAAAVPSGQGLTAFAYERTTFRDANDNVVGVEIEDSGNPNGSHPSGVIATTYEYDILDNLTEKVQDAGYLDVTTTYAYDANENRVAETRGSGTAEASRTEWQFDERDLLYVTIRGANTAIDATTATKIDANGNVVEQVDANLHGTTTNTTDSSLAGDSDYFVFDGFDRVREITDRVGLETLYTYDSTGNVVEVSQSGDQGVLPGMSLRELARTTFEFDERNRRTRTNRHLFHYSGYSVGPDDQPGALGSSIGAVSSVTIFDRLGRPFGQLDAEAEYDSTNSIWTNATRTFYDGVGRQSEIRDPVGNRTQFTYDHNDNVLRKRDIEESDNASMVSSDEVFDMDSLYDALDRRVAFEEPIGTAQTTHFAYDSRDNLVRTIDALGNEVEFAHDALDRQVRRIQYLSASGTGATSASNNGDITVGQEWDALSRITERTDDRGNATEYTWDALSRQTQLDYADGSIEEWTYNNDSELIENVNQTGYTRTWNRDARGRPSTMYVANTTSNPTLTHTDPDYLWFNGGSGGGLQFCWFWDDLDRLWFTCDFNTNFPTVGTGAPDDVATTYYYDSLGRRIFQWQLIGGLSGTTITHEYEGNRLVSETYPSTRVVHRSYDGRDRLTHVRESSSSGSLIADKEYIGDRLALMSYGNGTVLNKASGGTTIGFGYDANRRHLTHEWKHSSTTITSFVNTYNLTNRRTSETRGHLSDETDTYTFDSAYRMLTFRRRNSGPSMSDGVLSSRTLDGADKMTAFSDEGTAQSPGIQSVPGLNQYTTFGGNSRAYNQEGALQSRVGDNGLWTFQYDTSDRIVFAYDSTGTVAAQYLYDAENRRVARGVANGSGQMEWTRYAYSGWRVLEEAVRDPSSGTITVAREYVDGSGIDEHLQMKDVPTGDVFYYHCNSQGFVGRITDDPGGTPSVVMTYEYSWLGRPEVTVDVTNTPAEANAYMFQGRRYDSETQLYQFRYRYYDPSVGEFWSIDPSGMWRHGQGNGYAAFCCDPINYLDALGLDPVTVTIGGFLSGFSVTFNVDIPEAQGEDGEWEGLEDYEDPSLDDVSLTGVTGIAAIALGYDLVVSDEKLLSSKYNPETCCWDLEWTAKVTYKLNILDVGFWEGLTFEQVVWVKDTTTVCLGGK